MSKITEWNPGEKMSKEFAVATVKQVKQMFRCHFNNPNFDLFNNQRELFDTMMDALDGLMDLIDEEITEQQVSDTNSNPALKEFFQNFNKEVHK